MCMIINAIGVLGLAMLMFLCVIAFAYLCAIVDALTNKHKMSSLYVSEDKVIQVTRKYIKKEDLDIK